MKRCCPVVAAHNRLLDVVDWRSRKTRMVPIATARLRLVLEWLHFDADGSKKPDDSLVFSDETGAGRPVQNGLGDCCSEGSRNQAQIEGKLRAASLQSVTRRCWRNQIASASTSTLPSATASVMSASSSDVARQS